MCQHIKILFAILLCLGCLTRFSVCCKSGQDGRPECKKLEYFGSWSPCSQSCGNGSRTRFAVTTDSCPLQSTTERCFERECYTPPRSRSCSWANWGQWSSCARFGSLGSRSRSRKVSSPAFYGGTICSGDRYQVENWCSGGAQLSTRSDSTTCSDLSNATCEGNYSRIPNIAVTSTGYDIMERATKRSIFDNDNFCGECQKAYPGIFGKQFRIPYNIQTFKSSTTTLSNFTTAKDVLELNKAKIKRFKNKCAVEGFQKNNIVSLCAQASGAEETRWKKLIKSSTISNSMYFIASSYVEIAEFRMRSNDLILTSEFRNRIAQLPLEYEYGKYASFLSDFGTHYYAEGKLGGTFEAIFEYTRSQMKNFRLKESEHKANFKTGMRFALFGAGASKSGSNGRSTGSSRPTSGGNSFIYSATGSESVVRGGVARTAIILARSKGKTNAEDYAAWVDSIKHNPAVINFKLKPISQLVRNRARKLNIKRALEDLLKLYNAENCRGRRCRNGGHFVVTDEGKSCTCVCPSGYYGTECGYKS